MPQSINTFTELNSDSHAVNTSNRVMTDAINATLTTKGENQLILQNMEGNEQVAQLTEGFQALGFTVYNDISYIVSGKFDDDGVFIEGEIGTFPSPDWTGFFGGPLDPEYYLPLQNSYQPLKNFSTSDLDDDLSDDVNYFLPFRTNLLNFKAGRLIEVKSQASYDGSVNIIFTDDYNPVRLVNSRFKLNEDGKTAAIADRRQTKDTNTYSNKRFGATKLLKQSDTIPDLTFLGVSSGGNFKGGGYRFYFKYMDTDGALTDIVEESRLVTMAYDDHGATHTENTGKLVKFRMGNVDKKFSAIKVFYSHASGETDTTTAIYEVTNIYDIDEDYEIDITLYGDEDVILIDTGTLNLDYSSIDTAKTIEQYDSQLLLGNITNNTDTYEELKSIAQGVQLLEVSNKMEIKSLASGYADPNNVYFNLGYWAGETYEFGIVFILKNGKGNTPVMPIRGGDNYLDTFSYTGTGGITTDDGYVFGTTENKHGAWRTRSTRQMLTDDADTTEVKFFRVYVDDLTTNTYVQENTEGFFFVRKERKRDCIVQGYLTNTCKEPVTRKNSTQDSYLHSGVPNSDWFDSREHIQDMRIAIGKENTDSNNLKVFPSPGRIWESTIKTTSTMDKAGDPVSMQGIVMPNPQYVGDLGERLDMFYAFYAPDALADGPLMASTFNGAGKGIMINSDAIEATQTFDESLVPTDNTSTRTVWELGATITSTPTIANDDYGFEIAGKVIVVEIPGSSFLEARMPIKIYYQRGDIDPTPVNITTTAIFSISAGGFVQGARTALKTIQYDWNMNNAGIVNAEIGTPVGLAIGDNLGVNWDLHLTDFTLVDEGGTEYIFPSSISPGSHAKELQGSFVITNKQVVTTSTIDLSTSSDEPIKNLEIKNNNFEPRVLTEPTLLGEDDRYNYMQYIGAYQDSYGGDQFSAISDRSLYYTKHLYTDAFLKDKSYTNGYVETGRLDSKVLSVNNNRFADYIGLRMTLFDPGLTNQLRNDDMLVSNYNSKTYDDEQEVLTALGMNEIPQGYGLTGSDIGDYNYNLQVRGLRLATMANIYDSPDGRLSSANWKSKYSNTAFSDSYQAITKRYRWDNLPADNAIELFDGDCYVGHVYKRVMYGLGIPSNPAAIDPEVYDSRNQDTGLYPKGFVFPMVTENNYNVTLRTFDHHSEVEEGLYGKGRTFFPIDSPDAMRSTRQPESMGYNHGYDFDSSDRKYVALNDRAPILDRLYGNRVMVSKSSVDGNFVNGYVDFSGLNFRDYNSQLGELTKLIAHDDVVYCVFESGVGILPINQRTMVNTEGTGQVFLDDAQALASKMRIISSEYGSNQQFSVIKTDLAVYGVDLRKNKIWTVSRGILSIISDFAVQSIINVYKDRLVSNRLNNVVVTNYDRERNNVVFTYLSEYDGKFSTDLYTLVEGPPIVVDEGPTCPTDIVTSVTPAGREYYQSNSGQEITVECCTLLGGLHGTVFGDNTPRCYLPADLGDGVGTSPIGGSSEDEDSGDGVGSVSLGGGVSGGLGAGQILVQDSGTIEINPTDDGSSGTVQIEDGSDYVDYTDNDGIVFTPNDDGEVVPVGRTDERQNLIPELWKRNDYGSVYYNETLGKWVSRLSWNPLFMFNLESNLFSFNALASEDAIWKHFSTTTPHCHFYGNQDKFVFEFMVVDNSSVQKVIDNLMFITNRTFPGRITYGLIEDDVDYETFAVINNGYVELMKQRHEPPASVGWVVSTATFGASSYSLVDGMSLEETERLAGGFIVFEGVYYVIGNSYENAGVFYNEILDQNGISIPGGLPTGWTFSRVEFGIIKQNMEYIEDHLYIEVGQDDSKSRIRDKAIRVRVMYEGYDYTVVQAVISKFIYSSN